MRDLSQVSFRYFDDLAALFQEAPFHAMKRYRDVYLIHRIGSGPFEDRLLAIIDQRLALFGAVAPLVASARRRQGAFSTLRSQFEAYNLPLRRQVAMQFAIELRALEPERRELTIAATDAVLSFECYEFIIRSAGSDELARPVYRTAVRAIIRR
jgi:hypothetical protein